MPSNVALTVTRFAVGFPHISVPILFVRRSDEAQPTTGLPRLSNAEVNIGSQIQDLPARRRCLSHFNASLLENIWLTKRRNGIAPAYIRRGGTHEPNRTRR